MNIRTQIMIVCCAGCVFIMIGRNKKKNKLESKICIVLDHYGES